MLKQLNKNTTHYYPNPFFANKEHGQALTLLQIEMMKLSASIRSKPDWRTKYLVTKIRENWKKEIEAHLINKFHDFSVIVNSDDDCMADYFDDDIKDTRQPIQVETISEFILRELMIYDQLCSVNSYTLLQVSGVDGTWEIVIDDTFEWKTHSINFEKTKGIDYHPGSNQQVINLIHPSLFPLVSNRTLDNLGKVVEFAKQSSYTVSEKYQWLPSEFSVDNQRKTKITSYINNLDVRHSELYSGLEKIFDRFIPLFENVLTDLLIIKPLSIEIDYTGSHWYKYEKNFDKIVERLLIPGPDKDAYFDQKIPEYLQKRKMNKVSLRGKNLQVITKMANIVLTPEKPDYEGGSWHIEGMENESIVATGIFYYDVDNITESRLSFRKYVKDFIYEQNDFQGPEYVYGFDDFYETNEKEKLLKRDKVNYHMNQNIGSINCTQGKLIAFPNIYQHRVEPFSLLDKTKQGHRKILVFFLVDPNIKIISTKSIPPQQIESKMITLCRLTNLKKELVLQIIKHSEGFMDFEDALKYRLDLMNERKVFVSKNTKKVFERKVVLCEH